MNCIHFQLQWGPKRTVDSVVENNAAAPTDGTQMYPAAMQNRVLRHLRQESISLMWRNIPQRNLLSHLHFVIHSPIWN